MHSTQPPYSLVSISSNILNMATVGDGQEADSMVAYRDPEIEMTVLGTENNAVVVEQDGLISLEKEHQLIADVFDRYPPGNSSAGIAVINLANCIVGAGVICMPLALLQCGFWTGLIMMCIFAYLSFQSSVMLISAGETKGRLNYEELVADIFGNAGTHAFCIFVGILGFGSMCAYLIIAGDTVSKIVLASGAASASSYFSHRSSVIIIFGIVCALPLSLLRDMSNLSHVSSASIAADMLLALIVVFAGPREARNEPDIDRSQVFTIIRPNLFAGFGLMSFCFGALTAAFLVYRSMTQRGVQRWVWVTKRSNSIALVIAIMLGLSGYLNFVDKTQGNILNNFPEDNKAANAARGLLAITMVFTYPMSMYITRHVVDVSVFQTLMNKGQSTAGRHYVLTLGLWVLSTTVAMSTEDLGFLLELVGAFGSSTLNFTMPGLLYINAHRGQLQRATEQWKKDSAEYEPALGERLRALRNFYIPFVNVVFGIIVMVAGVATTILS